MFTFTATTSYPVTVEQVYGCAPDIPQGCEAIDFRPPRKDELVFGNRYPDEVYLARRDYTWAEPRLILRKKTRKRYVYTLANGEKRQAKSGDFYSERDDGINIVRNPEKYGLTISDYFIYTREVIEE